MSFESPLLQEQLEAEKRILEIQAAVLSKKEFVAGALASFAAEISGSPGKSLKEIKAKRGVV